MHRLIRCMLLSVLLIAAENSALAQAGFWQQTRGPRSTQVTAIALRSAQVVFVGTKRGVLRSTDGGDTWEVVGLADLEVNTLTLTPNGYLFAGTEGAGMYRSRDSGLSWDSINTGLVTRSVYSLASNASGGLVAGMEGEEAVVDNMVQNGIYMSTDYGDHWTRIGLSPYVCPVAITDNGLVYIGGWNASLSTDNGASWSPLSMSRTPVSCFAADSRGHLFAGTSFEGIFRSTDGGVSWVSASAGLTNPYIADLAAGSGDTLFAATHWQRGVFKSEVFRSTDNGRTWTPTALGNAATALAASPGGVLFAGCNSLFRSSDCGDHWSRLGAVDWQDLTVNHLTVSRGDTLYATLREGLFWSTDGGDNWSELSGGAYEYEGPRSVAVSPRGSLFMVWSYDLSNVLYRSTDHGAHWVELPLGLMSAPVFDQSGHMFAVRGGFFTDPVVYRSTDEGDSWEPVTAGLTGRVHGQIIVDARGNVFVDTDDKGLYRSTDEGAHWTSAGLTGGQVEGLASSLRGDIFAVMPDAESRHKVYRSSNYGENWLYLYTLPPWPRDMVADASGNLFVAIDTMGVYRNGVACNDGLAGQSVISLALDSRGYLFAGTGYWLTVGQGVYRSVQPVTATEEASAPCPSAFVLEQNYPNPFNPQTTIRYTLPHRAHVTLTVFNTLGQKVAELVNGEIEAGYHDVQFSAKGGSASGGNASSLASGVYFYRMQAGSFVETKRLLLLK